MSTPTSPVNCCSNFNISISVLGRVPLLLPSTCQLSVLPPFHLKKPFSTSCCEADSVPVRANIWCMNGFGASQSRFVGALPRQLRGGRICFRHMWSFGLFKAADEGALDSAGLSHSRWPEFRKSERVVRRSAAWRARPLNGLFLLECLS